MIRNRRFVTINRNTRLFFFRVTATTRIELQYLPGTVLTTIMNALRSGIVTKIIDLASLKTTFDQYMGHYENAHWPI